jgi:hypothetical protein
LAGGRGDEACLAAFDDGASSLGDSVRDVIRGGTRTRPGRAARPRRDDGDRSLRRPTVRGR